jgi:hypothetical protein
VSPTLLASGLNVYYLGKITGYCRPSFKPTVFCILMRLFILTFLFASVILQSCKGKEQAKTPPAEFYSKDFNWRIEIPEGFDTVSAEQWGKLQNRGADAIEKTYGAEVENKAKTLFVVRSDQFNYFESNYQPFDTLTDGNYLETCKTLNDMVYGTYKAQMPGTQIDSSSYIDTIDGLKFQAFKVNITLPDKKIMEVLMCSRLFGNKEFSVNMITMDAEKRKVLFRAWKHSTFGKNE